MVDINHLHDAANDGGLFEGRDVLNGAKVKIPGYSGKEAQPINMTDVSTNGDAVVSHFDLIWEGNLYWETHRLWR
jgi:hypothetical protein